jgi:hypothetical protein
MWGLLPLRDSIEEVIGKVGSAEGNKAVLDVGMSDLLNVYMDLTDVLLSQGCGSGQWYVHWRRLAL